MENINLSDTITLKDLFDKTESWGNLPSRSLSSQQVALINLRNSVYAYEKLGDLKSGGSEVGNLECFMCIIKS